MDFETNYAPYEGGAGNLDNTIACTNAVNTASYNFNLTQLTKVASDTAFKRIETVLFEHPLIDQFFINKKDSFVKITRVPLGFASSNNFHLKSWDSFLITYPFSKCNFVWGDPIIIPSTTKETEIDKYKNYLEEKINFCISLAESNLND